MNKLNGIFLSTWGLVIFGVALILKSDMLIPGIIAIVFGVSANILALFLVFRHDNNKKE